ncbi:MAG: binding domain, excisionase family protein [Candidatus Roizmanbacteria bacterium GW2011_GWA2_35_19]|uniref:Binding domain, excisionase family protein n=2 Tax=Candidatus Roizmaniibacteriota TaxID=1752723 RepID=A0A0G0EDG5_9BACT|nr:MAG: binding domain, excisionase family protein [Candidatus Roizmanbacteria bacterium GW2011_GWC2_35_12]KKP73300.1 MAG: binding domain, excisionase family protein [Candidatus Roizmanbacteria bacterium GW2011_GWA2_35_19]
MDKKVKLLRIKEAADILGVNPETLRRWDKEGKLPAVKVSVRGDRRYKPEDIEKFIEQNKKQI